MILTIEGNIGSGKSTLVKQLRTELASKWTFLDEPVDEWPWLKAQFPSYMPLETNDGAGVMLTI